jgi:hypothetical protein
MDSGVFGFLCMLCPKNQRFSPFLSIYFVDRSKRKYYYMFKPRKRKTETHKIQTGRVNMYIDISSHL